MTVFTKEVKKAIKTSYKLANEHREIKQDDRILIRREEGDIDWIKVQLLVNAKNEKEIREVCKDYPLDGVEPTNSAYDCTGEFFCRPSQIRKVTNDRYMVVISGNYDL